nr:GAF domain-containing protein [Thermoleophilaceae bacterium]
QLRSFAAEVTRVAREVGTEGKLGGQAEVEGVSGTWRGLTENVNLMAANLTDQVRNIAQVATAIAGGDLSQQITVDAKGEILELKDTINIMVHQLSSFADEVTRVAREVGTEGILGGQAEVEDVSGTWRALTDNVNQLAGNLTTQVRAIAEVSTAVTEGDLTRSITVDASGEVADLKDNINQMIGNLAETTRVNSEQDWLKTNLARVSGLMQGQRDLQAVSRLIMSEVTPTVAAQHAAFFLADSSNGSEPTFKLIASYGYKERKGLSNRFAPGEGLVGQAALEKQPIFITEAPPGYIRISSGLGEAAPVNVVVLPVVFEDEVMAVIELASFRPFSDANRTFLEQLMETVGVVLNTIIATMRTEELLQQSQQLTQDLQSQSEELQAQQDELKHSNTELEEQAKSLKASEELLQAQQEELQQTNEELEEKAGLLAAQNRDIEIKNREIEQARGTLEERAEQLTLSSKYKSEFLANMSHELRTPLNSLLILAKLLSDNAEANLTDKQVEFARTIHNAGVDLLTLINDILDLSKVEAGKMDVSPEPVAVAELTGYVERTFGPLADKQGLRFQVRVAHEVPETLVTDEQRLQQILKNLLSNAFKFTSEGGVTLDIGVAAKGHVYGNRALNSAERVLTLAVSDTGIGMPQDKLKLIFEAFQQAEGGTSRKYGGTGLGLSISREIARLLGGEIGVESVEHEGSSFILYLPAEYREPRPPRADDPVLELAAAPVNGAGPAAGHPAGELLASDQVGDDRADIQSGDRTLLVIEDDEDFARTILEAGRERGFKGLVALRGDTGLALAHEYRPDAILLDMKLPVSDGPTVLDHLKSHADTRHIPVHVISGLDQRHEAMRAGAMAYLQKPITSEELAGALSEVTRVMDRRVKSLLLVEDDE